MGSHAEPCSVTCAPSQALVSPQRRVDKAHVIEPASGAEAPFFGVKSALQLGAALLGALALIATLSLVDRGRLAALESFAELTAVGDTAYFKVPADSQELTLPAVTLNGQPLFPVANTLHELRDTEMIRAGRDATTGLTIYQPRKALSGGRDDAYFLKVGPKQYVKVAVRKTG